jgi:hypothetical protein
MWQKLYEFGKQLLTLKGQVEKNTQDIKELRQDLNFIAPERRYTLLILYCL